MPSTPYLTVDVDVLRRNLATMATWAAERSVALRPHAKTHKSLEIAALQLELGAVGLMVATIGEAEVFAAGGVDDLFIAYPIWADTARGARLRALADNIALRVGLDSIAAAEQLGRALAGTSAQVVVEVDCGQHRSGVSPDAVVEVATAAGRAGLDVVGVFTFPGHSYAPAGGRPLAAADEANALEAAVTALSRAGIEPRVCSGGSTPSVAFSDVSVLNEVRPGVYAFNDAQQLELGSCEWPEIALTVAATVVSHSPGRFIVDAGGKVLGADRAAWATGNGRLPDYPDARIVALSEHHATVELGAGDRSPSLGDIVRIAPNHCCAAVNLGDEYVVVSEGAEVTRWTVAARGRNS